jgi:hypothetical protein
MALIFAKRIRGALGEEQSIASCANAVIGAIARRVTLAAEGMPLARRHVARTFDGLA